MLYNDPCDEPQCADNAPVIEHYSVIGHPVSREFIPDPTGPIEFIPHIDAYADPRGYHPAQFKTADWQQYGEH